MPRVVVVLDIDAYAKDPRRQPFKAAVEKGELELGGSCPQCSKDLLDVGEVVYGKAVLSDGTEWLNSEKSFLDGGSFVYETKSLEWLFENYQLWGREDTIIVCSRECAELREAQFRQSQAAIERKNNPLDESSSATESVVIHGVEPPAEAPSPTKRPVDVPVSPTPRLPSTPHATESLEVPQSPLPQGSSPPPYSPVTPSSPSPFNTTPTAFKKGGRAPPPPPPVRSPSSHLDHDIKTVTEDTNPFTSSSNPFVNSSSSPPSSSPPSSSPPSSSPPSSSPPSSSPPSSSSSVFGSPFNPLLSPSNAAPKPVLPESSAEIKGETSKSSDNIAWCLDELAGLQTLLTQATKKMGELTSVLESLRRGEAHSHLSEAGSHPPPLPPLPEEEHVNSSPHTFAAPVVTCEADDVN